MCEPVSATIAATAIAGAFIQRSSARRMEANQSEAIAEQNKMNADARSQSEALEKSRNVEIIDLDADKAQSELRRSKKNRTALQQGMLGTIKTDPLNMSAPVATQKATLGT